MTHPGIELRVTSVRRGELLSGTSDWLHYTATLDKGLELGQWTTIVALKLADCEGILIDGIKLELRALELDDLPPIPDDLAALMKPPPGGEGGQPPASGTSALRQRIARLIAGRGSDQ